MALEIRRIGKHRQAGRASCLISPGMLSRLEIFANQAFGGRCFLDLCNQGKAARHSGLQRGAKSARSSLVGSAGVEIANRAGLLAAGDFAAFGIADFGKFVGHATFPKHTREPPQSAKPVDIRFAK